MIRPVCGSVRTECMEESGELRRAWRALCDSGKTPTCPGGKAGVPWRMGRNGACDEKGKRTPGKGTASVKAWRC